ncbi:MAG: S8 family serine peptidase [Desulfurococcus sp.]|nr:S8 family serine peptidase [Desulfurococcus sp.]
MSIRRVLVVPTLILLSIVILSYSSPMVEAASVKTPSIASIRDIVNKVDGNYISLVLVVDKSTPASIVNKLYSKLESTKFEYYGAEVSLAASRLIRDKLGNYVVKVFGPRDLVLSTVEGVKGVVLSNVLVKPALTLMNTRIDERIADSAPVKEIPKVDTAFVRYITGVDAAEGVFGVDGSGVTIAIVDTGVDYGHPNLQGKLIYWSGEYIDAYGNLVNITEPLVLDADESQVIILQGFTATNGVITIPAGTVFRVITPFPVDIPISSDITLNVTGVTSASGVYRVGLTYLSLVGSSKPVVRFILLADPAAPGVYTELYVDLDGNRAFTDPVDMKASYYGNRILVSPSLTEPQYSFGVAGGFFYDLGWWFSSGRFLPGWDLNGWYISIFYDFHGHGSACASAAAGVDVMYGGLLQGIAPGAKVIGVKALWWGNVELGMLWAAGFDVDSYGFLYYTGSRRADIISNSWGISSFIYDISGFGYDFTSILENALVTPGFLDPGYPGIIVVQAAGNGGGGYGTVTSPGSAAGVITVGASTSWWPYYLLFGYGDVTWDQIISWSARGPAPAGYLKPDVVNVGAFGLTASVIGWNAGYIGIFGGTSYATPLTAGSLALVLQALISRYGEEARYTSPFEVKQLLMNTADYLNYPPLDQGAGRVNVYRAVASILASSEPVIYSRSYYSGVAGKLSETWFYYWRDYIPFNILQWYGVLVLPPQPSMPSSWSSLGYYGVYVPDIPLGLSRVFDLSVYNPTSTPITVAFKSFKFQASYKKTYSFNITVPKNLSDYSFYVILDRGEIPGDIAFMDVEINMPFKYFDANRNYVPDYDALLYAYIWINDTDRNGYPYNPSDPRNMIQAGELAYVNYGLHRSSYNRLQIANPRAWLDKFASYYGDVKLVIRGRIWNDVDTSKGDLINAPVNITVTYYKAVDDPSVKLPSFTFTVYPGRTITVYGLVSTTYSTPPTVYQSYVKVIVNNGEREYYVPLTYTVVASLTPGIKTVLNLLSDTSSIMPSSHLRGENDWGWRYEAGDWRFFYVNVASPSIAYMQVEARWSLPNTSLVVYTIGPNGFFTGVSYGESVSWHRYLGSGIFMWHATGGVGGNTSTIIFPSTSYRYMLYPSKKPTLGVYTIAVRTVLFDSSTNLEKFTLSVWPLSVPQRLPLTPMPASGSTMLRVYFPYPVNKSTAIVDVSPFPVFSSQYLNPRTYSVTPESYTGSYPSFYIFTYTLRWSNTGTTLDRVDISILVEVTAPSLPVYRWNGTSYEAVTATYILEDWVITGLQYSWWFP